MHIYLVTNKDTHARAVVIARSAHDAECMRPDHDAVSNNVYWNIDRWEIIGTLPSQDRAAPPLECWPDDLERVHADEIGRTRNDRDCAAVLAFERDSQLRAPGEGPDETWGAQATLFEDGA